MPTVEGAWESLWRLEAVAALQLVAMGEDVASAVRAAIGSNLVGATGPIIGAQSGAVEAPEHAPRRSVVAAFAEQFVVDVSGISDQQRSDLGATFGAQCFAFVQRLFVVDAAQRARIGAAKVLGQALPSALAGDDAETVDLWAELETFMRDVARLRSVDAVTTELVRLRGARVHQCRLCQSRLSLSAVGEHGDRAVFEANADLGQTDERYRVATALAEALVTQPSTIDASLTEAVHAHFNREQIMEIFLDVVRNAANKIAVAFAADAAAVTDGIEWFDIDVDGDVRAAADVNDLRLLLARQSAT